MKQTVATTLRREAREMLEDLEGNHLHVAKVPSRRGGYVRVVIAFNAWWYRDFCKQFQIYKRSRRRRTETIIKRNHTVRGLKEIINGYCTTPYAKRLLPVVIRRVTEARKPRGKVSA